MDLEAIQILNLSPIPELSEIELSTMLEQLSGLSDINGDLTERNVEDILKEAEDLLDKSTCSQTQESRSLNKSPEPEENKLVEIKISKDKEKNSQPSDLEESKQTTLVSGSSQVNTLNEHDIDKDCNSSVENSSVIYSPCSSSNPIKSTIDSLKEFSKLIEKKLANKSSDSSPKQIKPIKKNQKESFDKEVTFSSSISKKPVNLKQVSNNVKVVNTPDLIIKKDVIKPFDKSIKLLNCFERLYRDKPVRLHSKNQTKSYPTKVVEKVPKTIIKKKFTKDLKSIKKNNWQDKNLTKKITQPYEITSQPFDNEEVSKQKQIISNYYSLNEDKCLLENEDEDETSKQNSLSDNFQSDGIGFGQSRMEEKLMLKVLEGMEEIKDQVKRVGAVSDREHSERIEKFNKKANETRKPEVNSEKDVFEPDNCRNSGIKRLEEQFFILKEKYNNQIDKLETENLKLREALNRQQETFITQDFAKIDHGEWVLNSSNSWTSDKKISRTFSLENCKAPKNSPCSSSEDVQASITVKEAFSQTEKHLTNTSIQCSQDSKEVGTNSEPISETKKTEDKENVSKKKPEKSRPFTDLNVHHSMRQKKALEHETQLLATLRGLQAEVTLKDKENRKLKIEIESLKRQMKKLGNFKVDNCRKCNIGTQTIGLGAFLQKPYNPENYQVSLEFERENEDLRSRIKALEEDFEFLKEKRISDLQSLHQVHEEEMAKLVSKLETQSALTKHLHSLLVNR